MNGVKHEHLARPWRVHQLAADFDLVDVWRFDLGSKDDRGFAELLDTFWNVMRGLEHSVLARIRVWVGQKLGWDAGQPLPIPGCKEHTVAARLSVLDVAANRSPLDDPSPLPAAGVKTIYRFTDEALYEISNKTIHALLHIGWVTDAPDVSGVLAVYVKHRGVLSRLYMAAIWPARHAIVYPAMVSRVERRWRVAASEHGNAAT